MSAIRLGSNIASLTAQRRLSEGTTSLTQTLERLSSGLRINRAADDAAGLAIASSLQADTRVFTQVIRNINDGFSVLSIAQSALTELSNLSIRQRELAEQAANGSYSLQQRRSLNAEANALTNEFNRIVESVDFNGRKLLDASQDTLRIQAGYSLDGSLAMKLTQDLARTVGDGSFHVTVSYAAEVASFITTADMNGDGLLDLITTGSQAGGGGGVLSVKLNRGDGTFEPSGNHFVGQYPGSAVAADINGDGIMDVVGATSNFFGPGAMYVHLGNGDGTLRAAINYTMHTTGGMFGSGTTSGLALGDVNGDGILDAVAAGTAAGGWAMVRLGLGDGTFGEPLRWASRSTSTIARSRAA